MQTGVFDISGGLAPVRPFPPFLSTFESRFGKRNGIFFFSPVSLFVYIVLEAARISSRTLSF